MTQFSHKSVEHNVHEIFGITTVTAERMAGKSNDSGTIEYLMYDKPSPQCSSPAQLLRAKFTLLVFVSYGQKFQ
jgi:hypothetical protein